MPLADDLRRLRDRTPGDLSAAHDYDTDTKIAWTIVSREIATGEKITIDNLTTGTVTTEVDLAGKVRGSVAEQLAAINVLRSLGQCPGTAAITRSTCSSVL